MVNLRRIFKLFNTIAAIGLLPNLLLADTQSYTSYGKIELIDMPTAELKFRHVSAKLNKNIQTVIRKAAFQLLFLYNLVSSNILRVLICLNLLMHVKVICRNALIYLKLNRFARFRRQLRSNTRTRRFIGITFGKQLSHIKVSKMNRARINVEFKTRFFTSCSNQIINLQPYLYLNPCRQFVYKFFIVNPTIKSAVTSIGSDEKSDQKRWKRKL